MCSRIRRSKGFFSLPSQSYCNSLTKIICSSVCKTLHSSFSCFLADTKLYDFRAEHGGTVSYTYTSSNPILKKYTTPRDTSSASAYPSPAASPAHSLPPSRSTSYESIPDVFHSAPNTPRVSTIGLSTFAAGQSMNFGPGMRRSTTGLSMTSLTGNALGLGTFPSSQSFTALQTSTSRPSLVSLGSMRRIPSLIDIQMYLGETQAAIESDDSGDETSEDERWEIAQGRSREEESENEEEHEGDENESRQTSRATSRNVSRVASREPSPAKMRREGTFSSRAVKFSGKSQLVRSLFASSYLARLSMQLTQLLLESVTLQHV